MQEWGGNIVWLTRKAQKAGKAQALRCLEAVAESPVHLQSLWCAHAHSADTQHLPVSWASRSVRRIAVLHGLTPILASL